MSSNIGGVGRKIRQLREQAQVTQRRLAETASLTVSYLSRLENERITPSVRTLRKIAVALEVPLPLLFGDTEVVSDHCPVSLSGSCILEHRYQARTVLEEVVAERGPETYSAEQLAVLQQCNDLLQRGDAALLTTLEQVVNSLVVLQKARETPAPTKGSQPSNPEARAAGGEES